MMKRSNLTKGMKCSQKEDQQHNVQNEGYYKVPQNDEDKSSKDDWRL